MSIPCVICGKNAIHTIPSLANGSAHYCHFDLPVARRDDANKGLYPLVKSEEAPAPKKKSAKAEPTVEEVAPVEEDAVELTDEDN
jgi:hypothetical protein